MNIASTILAGFQDDLVVLFGETLGWIVGHSILAAALATIVLGIKERDHIIQRSGFGKNEILDLGVFLLLTLSLFYICLLYTSPSPRDRQKSRMPSSA